MMWRINRESILLIGGRASLLLQLAHPLVAEGVNRHSRFQADPLGRLRRTMAAIQGIVFGDDEIAQQRAEAINAIHERVKGVASDGRSYYARDPLLLLWVYSTLVDVSVRVYETFVRALTADEKTSYYEDTKVVASLLGTPHDTIPPSLTDLRAWMDAMIATGEVTVTPMARWLADSLIRPLPFVPGRIARAAAPLTAALLPEPISAAYGLGAGPIPTAAMGVAGRAYRVARPLIPDVLATFPAARRASMKVTTSA